MKDKGNVQILSNKCFYSNFYYLHFLNNFLKMDRKLLATTFYFIFLGSNILLKIDYLKLYDGRICFSMFISVSFVYICTFENDSFDFYDYIYFLLPQSYTCHQFLITGDNSHSCSVISHF